MDSSERNTRAAKLLHCAYAVALIACGSSGSANLPGLPADADANASSMGSSTVNPAVMSGSAGMGPDADSSSVRPQHLASQSGSGGSTFNGSGGVAGSPTQAMTGSGGAAGSSQAGASGSGGSGGYSTGGGSGGVSGAPGSSGTGSTSGGGGASSGSGGSADYDFLHDNYNCGSVGNACTDGLCCDGTCELTVSDNQNCGRCGRVCAEGTTCIYGVCHAVTTGSGGAGGSSGSGGDGGTGGSSGAGSSGSGGLSGSGGASASTGGSGGAASCPSACSTSMDYTLYPVGFHTCSGNSVLVLCVLDANGCAAWTNEVCACSNGACQ